MSDRGAGVGAGLRPVRDAAAFDAGQRAGAAVLRRVLARERERLQFELLGRLSALPLYPYLSLGGGGALHGVHLHARSVKDLDFEAPALVARLLPEAFRRSGIPLVPEGDTGGRARYRYLAASSVFPEAGIGIEVFSQAERRVPSEPGVFRGAGAFRPASGGVPVRCLPLPELLLLKVGCTFRRDRAADYIDLWAGLARLAGQDGRHDPPGRVLSAAAFEPAARLAADPLWDAGPFTPPPGWRARDVVARMDRVRPRWEGEAETAFGRALPFERVREGLRDLLPRLEPGATPAAGR